MPHETDIPETPRTEKPESITDLIEIAGTLAPATVVVIGGDRLEDLQLVESARDHGIVDRIILVGRGESIAESLETAGIEIDPADIVPAESAEQVADMSVDLIKGGGVDIALKGNISTPIINRRMLPLAARRTVSLATVFDAAPIGGGRPMVMTDAGVTTNCSLERMVDLINNSAEVARLILQIERPRVAILSANEKQIASMPSTKMGAELTQMDFPDAVVYGPLSFDLATDLDSAALKGIENMPGAAEVAGQADVLVCPGIDSANILYKAISAMNKYGLASLASITVGFPLPYIILSRADSVETRLVSVAMCNIYARRCVRLFSGDNNLRHRAGEQ